MRILQTSANVDAAFLAIASKLVDMRRKAASATTIQDHSFGGSVPEGGEDTASSVPPVLISDSGSTSTARRPVCYGCANINSGPPDRNTAQPQSRTRRQTDEPNITGTVEMT